MKILSGLYGDGENFRTPTDNIDPFSPMNIPWRKDALKFKIFKSNSDTYIELKNNPYYVDIKTCIGCSKELLEDKQLFDVSSIPLSSLVRGYSSSIGVFVHANRSFELSFNDLETKLPNLTIMNSPYEGADPNALIKIDPTNIESCFKCINFSNTNVEITKKHDFKVIELQVNNSEIIVAEGTTFNHVRKFTTNSLGISKYDIKGIECIRVVDVTGNINIDKEGMYLSDILLPNCTLLQFVVHGDIIIKSNVPISTIHFDLYTYDGINSLSFINYS